MRLDNLKVHMPRGATVTMRPDAVAGRRVHLNGVGDLDGFHVLDEGKAIGFSLSGTTEAGEFLLDCLKQGRANFALTVQGKPTAGVKTRLALRVTWVNRADEESWLFKHNQSDLLGGVL